MINLLIAASLLTLSTLGLAQDMCKPEPVKDNIEWIEEAFMAIEIQRPFMIGTNAGDIPLEYVLSSFPENKQPADDCSIVSVKAKSARGYLFFAIRQLIPKYDEVSTAIADKTTEKLKLSQSQLMMSRAGGTKTDTAQLDEELRLLTCKKISLIAEIRNLEYLIKQLQQKHGKYLNESDYELNMYCRYSKTGAKK